MTLPCICVVYITDTDIIMYLYHVTSERHSSVPVHVIWHTLSYTCVIHDSYTCLTSYLFLVFRTPCCRRSGHIPATGSLSYSSPWSGSLTLGAPPGSRRFDLNPCCRLPLGKSKRKTGWPQGIEIGHRISGWCRVRYQSASLCYWISYILFIAFW